ncbi:hypothetical protein C8R46DRAFT_1356420 [Mycena filopes]|nr:hypothetical protein C8R46DRAFT_1356420 [Mycena filopes]
MIASETCAFSFTTTTMPSYPLDEVFPELSPNFTCSAQECTGSPLSAVHIRLCKQCGGANYCGRECQRADWPRHRAFCKSQATRMAQEEEAGIAGRRVACYAWVDATGLTLLQLICIYALNVRQNPAHIKTHFVVLTLRERRPRPIDEPKKLYTYESIEAFHRGELRAVLGQEKLTLEILEQDARDDAVARAQGNAGRVLLVINVLDSDDKIIYSHIMGIILNMSSLLHPVLPNWKDTIKQLINEGRNLLDPFTSSTGGTYI